MNTKQFRLFIVVGLIVLWASFLTLVVGGLAHAQETGPPGSVLRVPSGGGKAKMGPLDLSSGNATTNSLPHTQIGGGSGSIGKIPFFGSDFNLKHDGRLLFLETEGSIFLGDSELPDGSALLQMSSDSQGLLPPRMTQSQRDAISDPAAGLQVYNTDSNTMNVFNGTAWGSMGGGGGGGGGLNVLEAYNFDFGSGSAFWTQSNPGTLTVDTAIPKGGLKAMFDATAASESVTSQEVSLDSYTNTDGSNPFKGQKCQVHIPAYSYDGAEGDYVLKVLNGDDEELLQLPFKDTDGNSQSLFQTFDCPNPDDVDTDKRAIRIVIESTADGGVLAFNEGFLGTGRNNISFGSAYFAGGIQTAISQANCIPLVSSVASWTGFSTDSDCQSWSAMSSSTTVTGTLGQPNFTINNLKPGNYFAVVDVNMRGVTLAGGQYQCMMALEYNDGSGAKRTGHAGNFNSQTASQYYPYYTGSFSGGFKISSTANVTFRLVGYQDTGSAYCGLSLESGSPSVPSVRIYSIPDNPVEGNTYDTTGWRVDAVISGGNPSLGNVTVSSDTTISNSSLSLSNTPNIPGSIPAKTPCSSTNPSTGTICSAGDEVVGVTFNSPKTGLARVCIISNSYITTDSSGDGIDAYFKILKTSDTSQSAIITGKAIAIASANSSEAVLLGRLNPVIFCDDFPVSSGSNTFRLAYQQVITSTPVSHQILADNSNGRSIKITVEPLNESKPTPVFNDLKESLAERPTTSSNNKISYVRLGTLCSASPCSIASQSGDITSVTRTGTGDYTVNFSSNFSAAPTCFCSAIAGSSSIPCSIRNPAVGLVQIYTGLTVVDSIVNAYCIGPK